MWRVLLIPARQVQAPEALLDDPGFIRDHPLRVAPGASFIVVPAAAQDNKSVALSVN